MSGESATAGTAEADAEAGTSGSDDPTDDERDLSQYLVWVGVAVLGLTAVVALAGFYTGVSSAIRVWVANEYRPLVNAAFNLTLLLAAVAGIGLLLRRES
jgi:hypothetical protein